MILVDAHVHIHDCFELGIFLDSALHNFRTEANRINQSGNYTFILLLTETTKDNYFRRLALHADNKQFIGNEKLSEWSLHRTNEIHSLWAESSEGRGLFLVAGCQIKTEEDLEVLALITDKQFEDGLPLKEVVQAVKEIGAIPVIPWGFGKWIGKRGKILNTALERAKKAELFLGDNSGRPTCLPRPHFFKLAESKAIRVLPGSDPLPFASESRRPGSFGFAIDAPINPKQPGEKLKSVLLDTNTKPLAYGSLEKPFRFVKNQLKMQFKKRFRNSKALLS